VLRTGIWKVCYLYERSNVTDKENSMVHAEIPTPSTRIGAAAIGAMVGAGAAILIAGAFILATPKPAQALPKFAAETGLPCGQCHVNPAGGGPRNAFGKAFQANGFKLPKKPKK
jgi:hypothetical protein